MRTLFFTTINLRLRALTAVLLLVLGMGMKVMAQVSDPECTIHLPTAASTANSIETAASERGGGLNGQKLRVLVYWDQSIPGSLGIATGDWEGLLMKNIAAFDSTLHNTCVTDDYDNISILLLPLPNGAIPANHDDA